jgi:hypothetical protein
VRGIKLGEMLARLNTSALIGIGKERWRLREMISSIADAGAYGTGSA